MTKQETALVTGAGGFIGSHLVGDLLANGRRVIGVDVDLAGVKRFASHERFRAARVDIRQGEAMSELISQADLVFHLAAAHLEVGKGDDYFREINVSALQQLLEAAAQAGVRRFVHCSSVGVYGPLTNLPANETTPCHPEIAYESSKLDGERAVLDAASRSSLSVIIIRPSWVYGPACPRTAKLIRSVMRRRFFFVGQGTNLRHPIFIGDFLHAMHLAASIEATSGEVVIVAGPRAVTTRELVDAIQHATHTHYRPPTLPLAPVAAGCQLVESLFGWLGRQPPFSTRSLKFFTESSAFDTTKAHRVLGFSPRVELAEGLARTLACSALNAGPG